MTCKYAWHDGYTTALERIREFANKKADEARQLARSDIPENPYWWRAQGQFDITQELLDEIYGMMESDDERN